MVNKLLGIKPLLHTAQQLIRLLYVQIIFFFLFFWIVDLLLVVPLATLLLDRLLAFSGNGAIGNFAIAAYLLTPIGLIFVTVSLVIFVVTFMLEISGLLLLCHGGVNGLQNPTVTIFKQLGRKSPAIIRLATRSVLLIFAVIVPLVSLVVLLCKKLLSAHDINYYLSTQPMEYLLFISVATLVAIAATLLCTGIIISLAFALPQILFADQSAIEAYQDAKARFKPVRRKIFRICIKSLLLWTVLVLLVNLTVYLVGWVLIKLSGTSMLLLLSAAGFTLGLNLIIDSILGFLGLSVIAFLIYLIWYQVNHDEPMLLDGMAPVALPGRRMLLAGSLLTIAAALLIGIFLLNRIELEDHVSIIAHRGSSFSAPENSLSAVRRSSVDGADMAEIDVQLSRDGVVVLWHDNDAMRLSEQPLVIAETDLDILKTLDAGSWFSPKFADERIATLQEAVNVAKEGKIGLLVELKSYGNDKKQLVDAVVALLKQNYFTEQAPIMSLKHKEVEILTRHYPELEAGFVVTAAIGDLADLEEDFLIISEKLATGPMITALHAQGKKVFVWTIDESKTMSMLINQGIDGIITNAPDKMAELLKIRAELSPAEFLLLRFGELYRWR